MDLEAIEEGAFRVRGDLDREDGERLAAALPSLVSGGRLRLDLHEAEIDSGTCNAVIVEAVRALADRGVLVTLAGAPAALAHVLYRTGDLPRIRLVDPRPAPASS